jgi:hypothetical protein
VKIVCDDAKLDIFGQGIVLEKLARPTEALTSYDRGIAINAKYSLAIVGCCTVLNKNEQYKDLAMLRNGYKIFASQALLVP